MSELRVLIADDQALLRGSFRMLIDSAPDLTVVGEAETGVEAVQLARELLPDVVLMDVRMPAMDGIEATRLICAGDQGHEPGHDDPDRSWPRIIILTTFDVDSYVHAALRAGASGFLLKDIPPADLLSAIRVVASGEALLAPTVTRRLIAEFARQPERRRTLVRDLEGVTNREVEVLRLIAEGLANSEIATELHLSPTTVKTYIGRLLSKLHARDRAQLVIIAYESGLVSSSGERARP